MHRATALYTPKEVDDSALISRYAHVIARVARKVSIRSGGYVSVDDLWSAGALGLIEAHRRFDNQRAVKFETFAEHRIRGAMLDELRRMDHLPRRLRDDADKLKKARNRLSASLGREATTEEVGTDLGMDLEQVGSLESLLQPSLPITPELPIQSADVPAEARIERSQMVAKLTKCIGDLPPRLATLLSLHYVEELTYREIAQVLEVSEARVCQLHTEAIGKLRVVMAGSEQ